MNYNLIVKKVLLGLALIAFLGQTFAVNAAHAHSHDASMGKPDEPVHQHPNMMDATHHNHTQALPVSAHDHHSMTDHKMVNKSSTGDCCEDQCQCAISPCSSVYAILSQADSPYFSNDYIPTAFIATSPFSLSFNLFRPPISQIRLI